ncbi:GHKL domain-containing protein [Heliobacterium gestii]|uniref:histidine kinase n=1 Tax=Heliomicrobium gestii TaxID=2699 RepID=A0A845LA24_HELGE|nr:ATP-binding protein [Heliomicrobium gestii]MBM7867083.1 anti-sigma regulatory factor (Ser/Thr protein kinase) [Heliomicrobium gestii]MZP43502.1 GHKL domain-containing protein [Heliomicrobium gestii]
MGDVRVLVFYMIFEPGFILYLGMTLLGMTAPWPRLFQFSFIAGCLIWVERCFLVRDYFVFHLLAALLITIIAGWLVMRISLISAISLVLLGYTFLVISEIIVSSALLLFGFDLIRFFQDPLYHVAYGWLLLLTMAGITVIIHRVKKWTEQYIDGKARQGFPDFDQMMEKSLLIVTVLFASMAIVQVYFYICTTDWKDYFKLLKLHTVNFEQFYSLLSLLLLSAVLFFIKNIQSISSIARESLELKKDLESSRMLVKQYRSNQHEFLNHLQVIFGFIQINRPEKALEYIKEYDVRYRQGIKLEKIARPEVGAIIISKMSSAMGEGTKFSTIIRDDLRLLPLTVAEAVSFLGNLLQNALEAVQRLEEQERHIEIEFDRIGEEIMLRVANSGPPIPPENISQMFEYGFSTKGELGSGIGLSLIKSIVDRYNGKIDVDSNEKRTTFTVYLPQSRRLDAVTSPNATVAG